MGTKNGWLRRIPAFLFMLGAVLAVFAGVLALPVGPEAPPVVTAAVQADAGTFVFVNPSPPHDSSTPFDGDLPELAVDITDPGADVDQGSITFAVTPVRAGVPGTTIAVGNADLIISPISGGFRASIDLDHPALAGLALVDGEEVTISWSATAQDSLATAVRSDAAPTEGGDQDYEVLVDGLDPILQAAFTGDHWNAGAGRIEGDRPLGGGEFLPGQSDSSSIRVQYHEALDGSSILPDGTQYTVEGHDVTAAQHFPEAPACSLP